MEINSKRRETIITVGAYRALQTFAEYVLCRSDHALLRRSTLVFSGAHSIINRPPKPAWLNGLAVINIGRYRHFYRKKRASFAGAGDGAICGAATLSALSSFTIYLSALKQASERSTSRAVDFHTNLTCRG